MSLEEKDELCIFSMLIGQKNDSIHYNFKTSSNFLDFIVMSSKEEIVREMDARSDPRTNQISQLSRKKAQMGIQSKYGVGLIWDGKIYKDDLDLHVETHYGRIWYNNKKIYSGGKCVAKLDFDAGIKGNENEPAENISFDYENFKNKSVKIYIDNFKRRTSADIPCQIIISEQGRPDIVYDVVWPKHRRKKNYLLVCKHKFMPIDETSLDISENRARALQSQEKEFNSLFGVPSSRIACIEDFSDAWLEGIEYVECLGGAGTNIGAGVRRIFYDESLTSEEKERQNTQNILDNFCNFVNNKLKEPAPNSAKSRKKKYLSDTLSRELLSIQDLFKLIKSEENKPHSIQIHIQDHTPGYITLIETNPDDTTKCALAHGKKDISFCYYPDKFQHPIEPRLASSYGKQNARLNESWFSSSGWAASKANVSAIIKVDKLFFLCLENAILPDDPYNFPLSAGFYLGKLSSDGYKHRSKWSYLNTSIKPLTPPSGNKCIGCFLTKSKETIFVDGKKYILNV
jgi:hypothetical protein